MGAVTLKGLVSRQGLSMTTVSQALVGYGHVAEATHQCMLEAVKRPGCVPHATARRLHKGRTDIIGSVILGSEDST